MKRKNLESRSRAEVEANLVEEEVVVIFPSVIALDLYPLVGLYPCPLLSFCESGS
jgi:hypothetical protein